MERRISVSRSLQLPVFAFLLICVSPAWADHVLVLIASADSPIESVSSLDLRKVYLGFTVNAGDGRQIRPLVNDSDSRLKEHFLQNVVGMSARSYDRRLLALVLQTGRRRPEVYSDAADLIGRVASDGHAVAFVWEEDAKNRTDIKILRVLWQH